MVMEMVILQINPETSQVINQVMVVVMALVIPFLLLYVDSRSTDQFIIVPVT